MKTSTNRAMHKAIVPYFTVILFSTLLFLVAVPQGTLGENRVAVVKRAVSLLGPFVNSYLEDLRQHRESEKVKIRVWMHNGDPQLNGCGIYFVARGQSGASPTNIFPEFEEHECGYEKHRIRVTSPGAVYNNTLHLGNQNIKEIEVNADGWYNTFVNVMCFGLTEQTIAYAPRGFCINNQLLKGCKLLLNKWNDIDINWDDLLLTRSTRGIHKIIIHDVLKVVSAIERLEKNSEDTDAMYTVCDRMELVRGGDSASSWDCPADKITKNTSPYGCNRPSWGGYYESSKPVPTEIV